jgi:hypothetical protein
MTLFSPVAPFDASGAEARRQKELLEEAEAAVLLEARRLDAALQAAQAVKTTYDRGLVTASEYVRVSDQATRSLQGFMLQKLDYAKAAVRLDAALGKLPAKWDAETLLKTVP